MAPSAEVRDVQDPEKALNRPEDSAHGAYNATTLKDADALDEDGHRKRTGAQNGGFHFFAFWQHLSG